MRVCPVGEVGRGELAGGVRLEGIVATANHRREQREAQDQRPPRPRKSVRPVPPERDSGTKAALDRPASGGWPDAASRP